MLPCPTRSIGAGIRRHPCGALVTYDYCTQPIRSHVVCAFAKPYRPRIEPYPLRVEPYRPACLNHYRVEPYRLLNRAVRMSNCTVPRRCLTWWQRRFTSSAPGFRCRFPVQVEPSTSPKSCRSKCSGLPCAEVGRCCRGLFRCCMRVDCSTAVGCCTGNRYQVAHVARQLDKHILSTAAILRGVSVRAVLTCYRPK